MTVLASEPSRSLCKVSAVGDGAIPRTRAALADYLDGLGVAEKSYHLYGAHLHDAVMDHRPEGWAVFYSERGGESALKLHRTEADACSDLLARRTRDAPPFFRLVAGPGPARETDAAFDVWLAERGTNRASLLADDWKFDDVPYDAGPLWRRYFVRTTAIHLLYRAE